MGKLVSIAYSDGHGLPRPLHEEATVVADHGIDGDLRAGRAKHRQLNIMDAETIEHLKTEGFAVGPGIMGENLVIEGLLLDQQPEGTRIRIGDSVAATTTGLREPCTNLTPIDSRMPDAVVGRVGVLATVTEGGAICVGDTVELIG
jgi:molybdopterin adenylyltransferase